LAIGNPSSDVKISPRREIAAEKFFEELNHPWDRSGILIRLVGLATMRKMGEVYVAATSAICTE
jgi:hypothetical protein